MCQQKTFTLYGRVPNMHNTYDKIIYNDPLKEKSTCIHYWTPPYWFHAVNRLEIGSQGLMQTSLSLINRMRKPKKNPKPLVSV